MSPRCRGGLDEEGSYSTLTRVRRGAYENEMKGVKQALPHTNEAGQLPLHLTQLNSGQLTRHGQPPDTRRVERMGVCWRPKRIEAGVCGNGAGAQPIAGRRRCSGQGSLGGTHLVWCPSAAKSTPRSEKRSQ